MFSIYKNKAKPEIYSPFLFNFLRENNEKFLYELNKKYNSIHSQIKPKVYNNICNIL